MKKNFGLFTLFLFLSILFIPSLTPAKAARKDFQKDYLGGKKLETPAAPYMVNEDNEGNVLRMYYYQPTDFQELGLDMQIHEEQDDGYFLEEEYGVRSINKFYQIDVKFNDEPWLSSMGSWDDIDEYGDSFYGDNLDENNLTFLLKEDPGYTNADRLKNFTQSWLAYFDPENPVNDFLKPYVISYIGSDDYPVYVFDFKNTTISYRMRSCLSYNQYIDDDNEKWVLLVSDWSDVTSIGKDGKQEELVYPEKIDAPVLSEFKLTVDEEGNGEIIYFATLPKTIYQAERYRLIAEDAFEAFYIDAECKINDGEWFTVDVANSEWLNNGYRSSYIDAEKNLKTTDDVWIRLRLCDHATDGPLTEWSNIIGTKAEDGENAKITEEGKLSTKPSDQKEMDDEKEEVKKGGCKLCGFCPFQPLGICLFVWIVILFIIIMVIVVFVLCANKKKKKDE